MRLEIIEINPAQKKADPANPFNVLDVWLGSTRAEA
jgi:hypothetical protein